jgi:polygalacturonase
MWPLSIVPAQHYFNIRDYGAVGDGRTLNTAAIQKTIDSCATTGGTVFIPPGTYLTGTLFLKSNVALHLDHGAMLLGSTNQDDYPITIPGYRSYTDNYVVRSLIYAEKAKHIAIVGSGIIDGQGRAFKDRRSENEPYRLRPYLIRMIECQDIKIKDITLRNSPMWVQHYLACDDVNIDGITVKSRVAGNNDGIDIDSCHRVRIANCNISSGDDAIVLKSTSNRVCQDVVVTNCILSSHCNAFKLGTESNGGFQNIIFSNCTIYDTRLSAIALEMVDGGLLEHVQVNNIVIDGAGAAIFVRLGNRARPFRSSDSAEVKRPGLGTLRNVSISHITADRVDDVGCSITGIPDKPAQNIRLRDIRINYAGGGDAALANAVVPENEDRYPEHHMFGHLPAYGFYIRHVDGISIHSMSLSYDTPDFRPAIYLDDVQNLKLYDFAAQSESTAPAMIRMKNVRNGMVNGCRFPSATTLFDIEETENIVVMSNDLSNINNVINQKGENSNIEFRNNYR